MEVKSWRHKHSKAELETVLQLEEAAVLSGEALSKGKTIKQKNKYKGIEARLFYALSMTGAWKQAWTALRVKQYPCRQG